MITISVLGLDQYVVGHYAKDHTANIAALYETSADDVSFYAPSAYLFHAGVEQTSWDTLVRVLAPQKYLKKEDSISRYILRTLKDFSINVTVIFEYYEEEHRHFFRNEKYPRFLKEENLTASSEEEAEEDDDGPAEDDGD